ncbi:hypothetical protein EV121DRAFT_295990 [Schizophyllum commune]
MRGRTDEAEAQAQANARESPLSNLENLLLAQAAYEFGGGGSAWSQVSKTLNRHALTNRPASYFNAPMCRAHHTNLMNDHELDPSHPDNAKPHSAPYKQLAEILFVERFRELEQQIKAEEAAFKRVWSEIEDIKAGKWDAAIAEGRITAPRDDATTLTTADDAAAEKDADEESPAGSPDDEKADDDDAEGDQEQDAEQAEEEEADVPETREPSEVPSEDEGASSGEEPLQNQRRSSRISSTGASRMGSKGKTPEDVPEAETEEMQVDDDEDDDEETETRLKRKASPSDHPDNARDAKRAREGSEATPDEDQNRRNSRRSAPSQPPANKNFKPVITMLHEQISQHRNGNIFHNPIKTSEAPDYYRVVKRPIDLKTIKARIRDGAIASTAEFHRDILLMFANSMMYNHPETDIHQMAAEMMLESEQMIETHRQTEAWSQT